MRTIGYHCSHEQFAASQLLTIVRQAEAASFTAAMCSDHFHPWLENHGQSGFAWPWLPRGIRVFIGPTITLKVGSIQRKNHSVEVH